MTQEGFSYDFTSVLLQESIISLLHFLLLPAPYHSPHLKHVAVVILDAVLPELLQREHAAYAHFVEDLLHDIWEWCVPESGFPIHSKAQQLGELQAVLVGDVCQGLQDALVGTLEACVSQDGGHGLVEQLPAGGPAQLGHRLPFSSERQKGEK